MNGGEIASGRMAGAASLYAQEKDARLSRDAATPAPTILEEQAHNLEVNFGILAERVASLNSHLDRIGVPRVKERNTSSVVRALERDAPPVVRIGAAVQLLGEVVQFPLLEALERISKL